MTQEQALARLHEALPRGASFLLDFQRTTQSERGEGDWDATDPQSLPPRDDPARYSIVETWSVVISDRGHMHCTRGQNLERCVADAVGHYFEELGRDEAAKPPKLVATSLEAADAERQKQAS
jgi:hypothetical protein